MFPFKCTRRAVLVSVILTAAALFYLPRADAHPVLQNASCLNAPAATDPTATVCISNVIVPFNGMSEENQFAVSWRTSNAAQGRVQLRNGDTFDDVRGTNYRGQTHYVIIRNLAAKSTYAFDLISDGETFTNGGAHWTVRMGSAVDATTPYFIFGRVKNPDGSDADGTIVYAQVRDGDQQGTGGRSGLVSAIIVLADGGNFFNMDLQNARTQNNANKFVFNPATDHVILNAFGAQGSARKQFDISDLHPPKPPASINLSASGTGNVTTATPTLSPTQTLTPSNTTTQTATHMPTAIETRTAVATETLEPNATETPALPPTFENVPTIAPDQATRLASTPDTTSVAIPAGEEVEPPPTRVFGGVPVIEPPAQANNTLLLTALALVLFVGAVLLGLAAYFVSRR